MSLNNLFDKNKSKHIQKPTNSNQLLEDVESIDYIEEYIRNKYKYESVVDYSTASNFAVYGSAEEYYKSSIESIYQNYPYDGSAKEKLEWVNDSNPLQIYLFEKEYPRTNGFVRFNPGSSISTVSTSGSVNNHRNPTVKEYISLKGGPHIDNIWNTSSYRTSNLEINASKGNTVEFWLKKDAFSASNRREVLLDIWSSSSLPDHHEYARFTIELDQQNAAASSTPFVVTYKSGSAGVHQAELGSSHLATSASDGKWHHYAITVQNTGSNLSWGVYVDGALDKAVLSGSTVDKVNRRLVGTIGALATGKAGKGEAEDPPYNTVGNSNLGWGKLSGSLDEFRYWKTKRSPKEIARHWFTQINGGTNTDEANSKLGVYYKFNEGVSLTSSVDSLVLDYSGRLSNGIFVGYTDSNRSTDSAIVKSGVASSEFKDPIIHTENPRLNKFVDEKTDAGLQRDLANSSCLIHTIPAWVLEEDGERGQTRKLLQIIGSYFDVLHAQIGQLPKLKHLEYNDYDEVKPFPFMSQVLASHGLDTTEMFLDATALEVLADKTEEFEFEQKLHDIKNFIYRNLYNSLVTINKSKGTEKAFRNILRTHGVDEELIKLKAYSDNATYELKPNYEADSVKKRYANFQGVNKSATIFQYSSSFGLDTTSAELPTRGFITGSTLGDTGLSFTTQAEIIFPHLFPENDNTGRYKSTPISSSLFGAHTVQQGDSTSNLTFRASDKDFANFEILAAKEEEDSKNARFILKSTSGIISEQQTKVFRDVYDGEKWNFAFRIAPSGSSFGSLISGSNAAYTVELFGVNVEAGQVKDKFKLSQDITKAQGADFHKFSKRIFVGAHRRNFTGSVLQQSDVKISSVRHWVKYLDDETITKHAVDPKNYGVKDPYESAFSLQPGIDNHIPNIETLAMNWDFAMITGSTAGGQLVVQDFSSGSIDKVTSYGDIGQIVAYNHPARGDFFEASSTSSIALEYVPAYRQREFENIVSSDMIRILSDDDKTFTRGSRPVNYVFSFEKSMYQSISQEMIDLFSSIRDFGNVIGEPVDRYRQTYKPLDKLRALFFQNVENDPDVEKYIEFYRWIDDSLSTILDQYKPASTTFTDGIKNVIESHALERNKYWAKFPTLEMKQADPEGRILGINELTYDWEHGHAPLPSTVGPVSATATITFADVDGGSIDGGAITIISTDGTSRVYIPKSDATASDLHFDQDNGFDDKAAALKTAIESAGGHNGKITVSRTDNVLTLTQAISGDTGNTTITETVTDCTAVSFTGGADILLEQSENCRWWKDRTNRKATRISTGDAAVDAQRETLRKRINTVASGSTYTLRRLTKPYKLEAGIQHVLHGGSNFHLNKKLDFFKGTTNPGSNDYIRVSGSDIDAGPVCDDVNIPKYRLQGGQVFEKKKFRGTADISDTNRDFDIGTVLPFSLYSSSIDVPTDYKKEIYDNFKKGVEITNLHDDAYGDDREIPIQGPFTQHHVGGHFHRHIELNRSASVSIGRKSKAGTYKTGLDGRSDRREAFFISASHNQLYVLNPDMEGSNFTGQSPSLFKVSLTSSYAGRSNVLRDPLAKRPVNIRNIKTSTASLNLGNYQHDYQIVLGTSVEMSKDHIVENEKKTYSVDHFLSHSSDKGGYVATNFGLTEEFSSSYFYGYKDTVRPEREVKKHLITSRFSSPGGPETAGTAHGGPHIDTATNQISAYSSLNYRNLTQRMMLDVFAAERSEAFGHRFLSSVSSSTPSASYHKTNRNHRYAAISNGGSDDIFVRSDNLFVQHQIPQTDLGYAWIRNSTIETTGSYRRFESDFTEPVEFGTSAQTSSSPLFLSASEVGSFKTNINMDLFGAAIQDGALQSSPQSRLLLATKQIIQNDKNRFIDFTPVDFAGLRTIILDNVDKDSNILGYDAASKTTVNVGTSPSPNKFDLSDFNYINDEFLNSNQTVNEGASTVDPSGQMIDGLTGSQGAIGSHLLLNAIISNRGGQYGYPSWKQLRAGQHPIATSLRRNNIYSFVATELESNPAILEASDPSKYKRRAMDSFAVSAYNWPDSIEFSKRTSSRRVDSTLTRFTESALTNQNIPIRFIKNYSTDENNNFIPIPVGNPDRLSTTATSYTDVSYGNLVSNFSNLNLKSFLRLDQEVHPKYLQSFKGIESVADANSISYKEVLFPQEQNAFLKSTREREDFDTNWWSLKRSDRVKTKSFNSQGQLIRNSSKWPLDAQENFGTSKEISLGVDHPGRFGEGELVSATGLFRGIEGHADSGVESGFLQNTQTFPSASATYARRFPETPKVFKIHIKQDGFTYADMSGTHNYSAPLYTISESAQSYRENESEGGSDAAYFGHSLRLADATTLYVGGWSGPASGTNRGRVHKFNYTPDSGDTRANGAPGIPWVEDLAFELTMSDAPSQTGPANAEFGWHIDTQGDYLAVGAPGRQSSSGQGSTNGAGGIYIYKLSTVRNSQHEALILKGEATAQSVGKNLALGKDGTSLIYGMYKSSSSGVMTSGTGKAFIVSSGAVGGWQQEAEIVSDDPSTGQYFGREVRFSGSYVAISATGQYVKSNSSDQMVQGGVVHIYKSGSTPVNGSTSGSWAPVCVFTSSHPTHTTGPRFGANVSFGLGNKHVVIGEPEGIRGGAGAGTGSVQIWRFKDDGTKVHVQTITNPVTTEKNYFGAFVSATPSWISISRPVSGNDTDNNDAEGSRAVLLYESGSTPGSFTLSQTLTRNPNFTSYYGTNTGKWVDAIGNIGGTDVVKNSMHMTVTSDNLPIVIHGLPDVGDSPLHDHDGSPFGYNKGEFRSWYATTSASLNVLREATFYMKPAVTDFRAESINYITIVPPHHPDTETNFPDKTLAYIKLSESATTTGKAVEQIVDGLNSFEGNDSFSMGLRFKDVGKATFDADKRTIILEMFQSYQNSRKPSAKEFGKNIGAQGSIGNSGYFTDGEEFGITPLRANMPTTMDKVSSSPTPLEDRRPVGDAYFSASISNSTYLAGATKWTAGDLAKRYPFNFSDYKSYAEQIRLMGQDYSLVSEYRISEEMNNYIGTDSEDPFFNCPQRDFLTVTGSKNDFSDSSKDKFYEVYGHSDFMKYFNVVQDELEEMDSRTNPATFSLSCKGLKKLLPYEGFYPVQRMTQLATLFSQSYGPGSQVMQENHDNTRTSMGSFRTALAPFYAPGIGFNSVKSGIAVDYPVFVPKKDRPFMEVCTKFSGSAVNRVEIGDGLEWAQVFSGSARSATSLSSSAISVSMWIYPDPASSTKSELSQIQGTLVQFGGRGKDGETELNNGFNFYMSGSNLKLYVRDTSGKKAYFSMGSSGSAAAKRRLIGDSWNHVGVTLPLGKLKTDGSREPPIFFINGLNFTGSQITAASSTGAMPNLNQLDIDGYDNCTIGNSRSWSTGSYSGREFGSPEASIAEVCIFNKKLAPADVVGLYGSGSRYRGPWRPDMCVRPRMRNSLVAWYRMGNDTGIMTLSGTISDDANRTNRKPMSNKAWLNYSRKHRTFNNLSYHNTGSETRTNSISDHGLEYPHGTQLIGSSDYSSSLSTAKFRGFSGGYGVTLLSSISSQHQLTGAFKYPSYITGSQFNETADGGIPRIGSASWANFFNSDQDQTLTTWQRGSGQYGIQRVERIPFEAIVDPARSLFSNGQREVTEGQFDETLVLYETEPHPSASLQPCSFVRVVPEAMLGYRTAINSGLDFRKISVSTDDAKADAAEGGYAFFGMPNTSSMMTSSFSLTAMRALGKTLYSEAANNFYAETMNFFLENGHSTVIASEDTPQRPIEYGKTYRMKLRMSRKSDRKDFPIYNLPQAFGPPVDASAKLQSGETSDYGYDTHFAHGYSGYTPPHFDAYAEVEYSFTPDEGENYEMSNPGAIESILTRIAIDNKTTPTIKYNRFIKATGSVHSSFSDASLQNYKDSGFYGAAGLGSRTIYSGPTDSSFATADVNPVTSSLNKAVAMQMSASFRGLGLDDAAFVSTFENNDSSRPIIRKSLSIQSKWECPNIDFKGVATTRASSVGLSVPKGMWHQVGNIDTQSTFVEILPPSNPSDGDLSELLGMHFKVGGQKLDSNVKQKAIGTIQERKVISEAVIAIPFLETQTGTKKFLELGDATVKRIYQEVKNTQGYEQYREWDSEIKSGLRRSEMEDLGLFTNSFVSGMVRTMLEHVIPPRFNFLKYNDSRSGKYIKPFMMYTFPFTHTLTKKDLGFIWQNLPPDIALDDYNRDGDEINQEVRNAHSIKGTPIEQYIRDGRMQEIQWMVFKVKRSAEKNYFEKMDTDRLPTNHPERSRSEKDLFNYGFNWPYDYFSLVELIKIDANTVFDKSRAQRLEGTAQRTEGPSISLLEE